MDYVAEMVDMCFTDGLWFEEVVEHEGYVGGHMVGEVLEVLADEDSMEVGVSLLDWVGISMVFLVRKR